MPITIPSIDDRRYQDLLNEALARIPVYTPEWTNFNKSDPGVTLIEIFAFLTETLLYRSNQIPERNRRKFLKLLGVPAKFLYFPDENHWILKPQNSRLWYSEFFAWLKRYVAAGGKSRKG